jgi:cyanobactin biosynthesis protein (PatB/AcyB/McaB family)
MNGAKRLPPTSIPVLRPGAFCWPKSRRQSQRPPQTKPEDDFLLAVGLVNPADLVDGEHGTAMDVFDLLIEQMHGANCNDPPKWRTSPFGR